MLVGVAGFEPATLWSQTRCATTCATSRTCNINERLFLRKDRDSNPGITYAITAQQAVALPLCHLSIGERKFIPNFGLRKGLMLICVVLIQINQIHLQNLHSPHSQYEVFSKSTSLTTKRFGPFLLPQGMRFERGKHRA